MGYFSSNFSSHPEQQYLAGGTYSNWKYLTRKYGGVDSAYRLRGLFVALTTLVSKPLRQYESKRYQQAVANTVLKQPPVFIIGHWRSGTTLLHRLITQSPSLTPITTLQTIMPGMFMSRSPLLCILKNSLPDVRPMDQVSVGVHESEEDEYALGNLPGTSCFYNALTFPRNFQKIFNQSVLFEGMDQEAIQNWSTNYAAFIRKVALNTGAERIVSKNPANTCRIPVLLDMFPGAKFIFIHRDPLTVYQSTMHWLDHELDMLAVQRVDRESISESVLTNYEKMISRYISHRELIPQGDLVEVRFEALEENPVDQVLQLFDTLGLNVDQHSIDQISNYAKSLNGYKKNTYSPKAEVQEKVLKRWGFSVQRWNY